MTKQQTIAQSFTLTGVGLHSGEKVTVTVKPATADEGRYFVRTDLPKTPTIPATVNAVSQTQMSTELANGEATVRTVEHLLSALVGQGIDNARIEVNGAELPLLDGSGKDWVEQLAKVGRMSCQGEQKLGIQVTTPVSVQEEDAIVAAFPANTTRFSYGIDFPVPAIGQQWYSWQLEQEDYHSAIAPARTFVLAEQVEALQKAGLIKGGSLENALVCNEDGWLNPPLRFANEPVRHKLLDLVGDLSLLGSLPQAHIVAYKASHRLHIRLAQRLTNQ
ncbi:UDP-3-O-(3-hydroxymyristoyl) N-acetylglucosamine deacetylase [Halothece sp. PCC 7418]|uniref:UDP-3-O-acyl-N-acetylglucosamine deacetylase n=1 Tax=Halothece sp. (strain PCC 7418) TaxID=65093 RepID=UPI0002A08CE1|nr:UDP-3-O-acyl-N-acetylglucosamine deacetylase [Halothece sp. PCC 7418]AFZ44645.1 UDP-3-O-(3-hydroxymyristoyl) N-acetylglucosamine deacetylase [Halothece sp. PCC 7418]